MLASDQDVALERLELPRSVATRETVQTLMDAQSVPQDLTGITLAVLCDDLSTGSQSFADELVLEAVLRRDCANLALLGAPPVFVERIHASAAKRGVEARISEPGPLEIEV